MKPSDSVRIVIFDEADPARFLLLTEADDADNWKLPGGKFNQLENRRETPDEAAQRELREETGLQVPLAAVAKLLNDDGKSARYIYTGREARAAIAPSEEVAQTRWYSKDSLPETKNRGHILSAVGAAEEFWRQAG